MKARNYSLDLLRVIAMFMILTVHFFGWGGAVNTLALHDYNYYIVMPIYFVSQIGNTLFFLLAGYFMKAPRAEKALFLERKTAFYSFWITLIVFICAKAGVWEQSVSVKYLIKSEFPVVFNRYWFISVYIILYVFSGVLVKGLENVSNKQILFAMAALLVNNTFLMQADMTIMQGLLAMITGYHLKQYNPFEKCSKFKVLAVYLLTMVAYVAERFAVQHFEMEHGALDEGLRYLIIYLAAILFFVFFTKLNVKSAFFSKFSGNVLAVYLITAHPALHHMSYDKWLHISDLSTKWWFVFYYVAVNLAMFSLCVLIDLGVTFIVKKEVSAYFNCYNKYKRKKNG